MSTSCSARLPVAPFRRLVSLDYGCGSSAPLMGLAAARGVDIYGVDLPCHQETDRFRLLDSEGRIPFNDQTFDVVVSNQVFETYSATPTCALACVEAWRHIHCALSG